jgi:hypothetical protein
MGIEPIKVWYIDITKWTYKKTFFKWNDFISY